METIASCAERALREHPHPALLLSELLELVAETVDRTLDGPRLRAALEARPDRFRLLDPWRGPWSAARSFTSSTAPAEAWVMAVGDHDPPGGAGGTALRLRESVRWLGGGIDPRSPVDVSRWYAIALAERAARAALVRRAA